MKKTDKKKFGWTGAATWRLAMAMVVLCVVIIGIFIYVNFQSVKTVHEEALTNKGDYLANQIASFSELHLYAGTNDEIQNQLDYVFSGPQGVYQDVMAVSVNDKMGRTVASYVSPERDEAKSSSFEISSSKVGVEGAVIGEVLVEVSIESRLETMVRNSVTSAILIVFFLMALFSVLYHLINRWAFKGPVRKISGALEAFYKEPNYQLELSDDYPSEYSPMISSMNQMASQIRSNEERMKEEVENAVAEQAAANLKLKEANRQVQEASRHKNDFTAKMTHELRTPTASIYSMAETLLKDTRGKSKKDVESMRDIFDAAKSLLREINELATINRLDKSIKKTQTEELDVIEVVRNEFRFQIQDIKSKGLQYYFNVGRYISDYVHTDEKMIEYVVRNLLGNAVKFTKKGVVAVGVDMVKYQGRDALEISVRDTGIGIKKEDQKRIFEEYTQLDEGITRKYDGTGLGLYTVKRYVEDAGGKISVHSRVGKGSLFKVVIPCKRSNQQRMGRYEIGLLLSQSNINPVFLSSGEVYNEMVSSLCHRWAIDSPFISSPEELTKKGSLLVVHNASELPDMGRSLCREYGVAQIISLETVTNENSGKLEDQDHVMGVITSLFSRNDMEDMLRSYISNRSLDSVTTTTSEEELDTEALNGGWDSILGGEESSEPEILDGVKVLVVDDNKQAQNATKSVCESYGAVVETAWSGKEAIRMCINQEYDCIFMDIMMPGQDGVSVAEEIKGIRLNRLTPVIALTASTSSLQGKDLSCFASTAEKPLNVDKVVGVITQSMAAKNHSVQLSGMPKRLNF